MTPDQARANLTTATILLAAEMVPLVGDVSCEGGCIRFAGGWLVSVPRGPVRQPRSSPLWTAVEALPAYPGWVRAQEGVNDALAVVARVDLGVGRAA